MLCGIRAYPMCVAAALLSGCAAVEVQVDAYKGPFANRHDVVLMKAAFIAESGLLLMQSMRDQLILQSAGDKTNLGRVDGGVIGCSNNDHDKVRSLPESRICEIDSVLNMNNRPWIYVGNKDDDKDDVKCEQGQERTKSYRGEVFSEIGGKIKVDDKKCLPKKLIALSDRMVTLANAEALRKSSKDASGQVEKADSQLLLRYSALLQSIGNSIQVAVNDISQLNESKERSEKLSKTDAIAVARMNSNYADTLYKELSGALVSKKTSQGVIQTDSRKNYDDLGARLVLEKEKLTRLNGEQDKIQNDVNGLVSKWEKLTAASIEKPIDSGSAVWPAIWIYDTYAVMDESESSVGSLGQLSRQTGFSRPAVPSIKGVLGFSNTLRDAVKEKLKDGVRTVDDVLSEVTRQIDKRMVSVNSTGSSSVMARYVAALNRSKHYLDALKGVFTNAVASDDVDKVYQSILSLLADNLDAKALEVGELYVPLQVNKAKLAEQALDINRVSDEVSGINAEIARVSGRNTDASKDIEDLDLAIELLRSIENDVISAVGNTGPGVTHESVYSMVNYLINDKINKADTATRGKLEVAYKTMKKHYTLPVVHGNPVASEKGGSKQQIDVMDEVLANLRYALIRAKELGNKDKVVMLESAIREAYEQRSGMIYLRPAISYLRSVSAATVLQSSSDSGEPNLLWDNAAGGVLPDNWRWKYSKDDIFSRKMQRDIDKQYWSNINSVKVSGGGNTGYVLVKDDIGNWYVKGYTADPGQIIRSAQGLGMFAMGGKLNMNLFSRLQDERELRRELDRTSESDIAGRTKLRGQLKDLRKEDVAQDGAPLKTIYDKYKFRYLDNTKTISSGLAAMLDQDGLHKMVTKSIDDSYGAQTLDSNDPLRAGITSVVQDAYTAAKPGLDKAIKILNSVQTEKDMPSVNGLFEVVKQTRTFEKSVLRVIKDKHALALEKLKEKRTSQEKTVESSTEGLQNAKGARDEVSNSLENLVKRGEAADKGAIEKYQTRKAELEQVVTDKAKTLNEAKLSLNAMNNEINTLQLRGAVMAKNVSQAILDLLNDILEKQHQAAKEFETALLFLGDAADKTAK